MQWCVSHSMITLLIYFPCRNAVKHFFLLLEGLKMMQVWINELCPWFHVKQNIRQTGCPVIRSSSFWWIQWRRCFITFSPENANMLFLWNVVFCSENQMVHINLVIVSVLCACGMSMSCVCSLFHYALMYQGKNHENSFFLNLTTVFGGM